MSKPKVPTLKQIAARIRQHLRRLERQGCNARFQAALAWPAGTRMRIKYQGIACSFYSLTKTAALQYLAYLDGGGTGTHVVGKKESDDA